MENCSGTLIHGTLWTAMVITNRFREMDAYFGIKESDTEDGVNTIKNEKIKENNDIYNLSGQRLNKPLKGINIVNGRKVAIM